MNEAVPKPYSIEVDQEPGGFRWKLRENGKLLERSQRLYESADRAHQEAVEKVQRMRHTEPRSRA